MANRKQPFGYEIRQGKICVRAQEANLVKEIFKAYVDGASYQQLTHRLNAQTIPYNESGKPWNKNMVARILNSKVYAGNKTYPAILSAEDQHRAIAAKPSTGVPLDATATSKAIRRLARCSDCGSTLTLSDNRYGWARWNCPSCSALTVEATTPAIVEELTYVLTAIINDPRIVQTPPHKPISFAELEDELSQFLHSSEFDESAAKAKTLALTAAQFEAMSSADYETMRIQYILSGTEQNSELDTDLLRQITSAILIHPTGAVSLKLKNGQVIERSDLM